METTSKPFNSIRTLPIPAIITLLVMRFWPGWLLRWAGKQHAEIVQLWPSNLARDTAAVLVITAEGADEVFKNRALVRSEHTNTVFAKLMGQGVANTGGAQHLRQRSILMPAFRAGSIQGMLDEIIATTKDTVAQLNCRAINGEIFNLFPAMQLHALEMLGRVMFSKPGLGTTHGDTMRESFRYCFDATFARAVRPNLPEWISDRIWHRENRRFAAHLSQIDRFAYGLIEERRKNPKDAQDVLSLLLTATEEGGQPLSDQRVRDELVTLVFAGYETVAASLAYYFWLLARHPEWRTKIETEAKSLSGNPDLKDLQQLTNIRATVLETLRCEPAVYIDARLAGEDTRVLGYAIPKGTEVFVTPFTAHTDSKAFGAHPKVYDPSRWIGLDLKEMRARQANLITFAKGKHRCLGDELTIMMMVVAAAVICRSIRFDLVPDHPMERTIGMTNRPDHTPVTASPI